MPEELQTVDLLALLAFEFNLHLLLLLQIIYVYLSFQATGCNGVAIRAEGYRTERILNVLNRLDLLFTFDVEELDFAIKATRTEQEIVNWGESYSSAGRTCMGIQLSLLNLSLDIPDDNLSTLMSCSHCVLFDDRKLKLCRLGILEELEDESCCLSAQDSHTDHSIS